MAGRRKSSVLEEQLPGAVPLEGAQGAAEAGTDGRTATEVPTLKEKPASYADMVRLVQGEGIALVRFTLRGVTPLLMNRRGLLAPPELGVTQATDRWAAKYALYARQKAGDLEEKCYRDPAGFLAVPLLNVRKCLLDGCRGVRSPFNASTNLATVLGRAIRTDMAWFRFHGADGTPIKGYVKAEHAGRNPGDWRHQGVNIVRPAIPLPWYLPCVFRVDLRPLHNQLDILANAIMMAGDAAGLGDWRQDEDGGGGPFGKFFLHGSLEVQDLKGQGLGLVPPEMLGEVPPTFGGGADESAQDEGEGTEPDGA